MPIAGARDDNFLRHLHAQAAVVTSLRRCVCRKTVGLAKPSGSDSRSKVRDGSTSAEWRTGTRGCTRTGRTSRSNWKTEMTIQSVSDDDIRASCASIINASHRAHVERGLSRARDHKTEISNFFMTVWLMEDRWLSYESRLLSIVSLI